MLQQLGVRHGYGSCRRRPQQPGAATARVTDDLGSSALGTAMARVADDLGAQRGYGLRCDHLGSLAWLRLMSPTIPATRTRRNSTFRSNWKLWEPARLQLGLMRNPTLFRRSCRRVLICSDWELWLGRCHFDFWYSALSSPKDSNINNPIHKKLQHYATEIHIQDGVD